MRLYIKLLKIIAVSMIIFSFYFLLGFRSSLTNMAAVCCEGGFCANTRPDIYVRCTSPSSMAFLPECEEITLTCYTCVDLTVSGCMCTGGSDFCMKPDLTFYYGQLINCELNK